jgi:hypothetical protein
MLTLHQSVNWIMAFSTPLFLSRSSSGPYFMFGGFALLTVVVCVAFQSGVTIILEGLDTVFEVEENFKSARPCQGCPSQSSARVCCCAVEEDIASNAHNYVGQYDE